MNEPKIQITFRHMEPSPIIEKNAYKHLEKLNKFLVAERTPIFIELVLEAQRVHHHHRVELRVKTPHYDVNVHREGPDLYLIMDEVITIAENDLRKAKEKRITENHSGPFVRPG